MNNLYIIIALFTFNFVSSQNIENLKVGDTIFLIFNKKESINKFSLKKTQGKFEVVYSFLFPENKSINFGMKYINDSEESKFLIRKADLINRKIFKNEDFLKTNFMKLVNTLDTKKIKIFVVEKYETKKRKVILRKVVLYNTVPLEM